MNREELIEVLGDMFAGIEGNQWFFCDCVFGAIDVARQHFDLTDDEVDVVLSKCRITRTGFMKFPHSDVDVDLRTNPNA